MSFKALLRPGMIIAAFTAGALFPECGNYQWMIRYLLIVMLYLVFLPFQLTGLRLRKSHILLAGCNIALPVIVWAIFRLLGMPEMAAAAFFTAAAPTASAAPVVMRFLSGRVNYMVTSFILTNLVMPAALFFMIPVMITGKTDLANFISCGLNLLILIGVPLTTATITRKIYPASVTWPKKCANFSFTLWVSLMVIISGSAMNFFKANQGVISPAFYLLLGIISLLICVLNFTLGYLIGGKKFPREASQSLGQKNTGLTIVLAATFASPLAAMGPTFYVLWHNLWNSVQLYIHDRNQKKSRL